jgi:hypothetical protein
MSDLIQTPQVAAIVGTTSVIVALIGAFAPKLINRKKTNNEDILSAIKEVDTKVDVLGDSTREALKANLLRIYEEEHECVQGVRKNRLGKNEWCADKDLVFREVYRAYKNLHGNGIIDSLKKDMDIWRDLYATNEYKKEK